MFNLNQLTTILILVLIPSLSNGLIGPITDEGERELQTVTSPLKKPIPNKYPTKENEIINPIYPYALTKKIGEDFIVHWSKVYKIPYPTDNIHDNQDLESILCTAIESRLQNDLDIPFFLSGGIDSNLIVSLAK